MEKQQKNLVKQGPAKANKRPGSGVGNVKKIDFLMGTDRDLKGPEGGATTRYILCSTPRCGSNMVGQMLHDTGLGGDPQEYLNQRYMAGYVRLRAGDTKLDLRAYLKDIERRRTSPNGAFGMKIHFEHLQGVWKNRMRLAAGFLKEYDKFVLLTRRDKVAQAVSLHKARETQIWSSLDYQFLAEDDPRRSIKPEYNAMKIARALSDLVLQEEAWRALLTAAKLPFIEVAYEDMVADHEKESRRVLEHLGITGAKVKAPSLKKQGQDNDPMIDEFKRYIGCGTGPAA